MFTFCQFVSRVRVFVHVCKDKQYVYPLYVKARVCVSLSSWCVCVRACVCADYEVSLCVSVCACTCATPKDHGHMHRTLSPLVTSAATPAARGPWLCVACAQYSARIFEIVCARGNFTICSDTGTAHMWVRVFAKRDILLWNLIVQCPFQHGPLPVYNHKTVD